MKKSDVSYVQSFFQEYDPEGCDSFFGEFTESMFSKMMNYTNIISLTKSENQSLWSPGDSADYFYFVLQGQILINTNDIFDLA